MRSHRSARRSRAARFEPIAPLRQHAARAVARQPHQQPLAVAAALKRPRLARRRERLEPRRPPQVAIASCDDVDRRRHAKTELVAASSWHMRSA